jgi:hypothetical protein
MDEREKARADALMDRTWRLFDYRARVFVAPNGERDDRNPWDGAPEPAWFDRLLTRLRARRTGAGLRQ